MERLKQLLNYLIALPFCGLRGTMFYADPAEYSTCVAHLGYDAWNRTLDVFFHQNRAHYRYFGVSFFTVMRLASADSMGQYLNRKIIRGQYRFVHLTWFPKAMRKKRILKAMNRQGLQKRRRV